SRSRGGAGTYHPDLSAPLLVPSGAASQVLPRKSGPVFWLCPTSLSPHSSVVPVFFKFIIEFAAQGLYGCNDNPYGENEYDCPEYEQQQVRFLCIPGPFEEHLQDRKSVV